MKKKKSSLSKVFTSSSIKIFTIFILVTVFTIMYFFYQSVLQSSITYGSLALKNQADIIEKSNTKYVYLLDGLEKSVSISIASKSSTHVSPNFLLSLLKETQSDDENIFGTYLIIKSDFLSTKKKDNSENDSFSTDENGYISFYHTNTNQTFPLADFEKYAFYNNPLKTNKLYVSNPETRIIGDLNEKVYPISIPLTVDGNTIGVIGFDINMQYIIKILEKINIYDGKSSIALLDNNGIYLTHSTHKELIGKNLKEDCSDPEARMKVLKEGKYENFYEEGRLVGGLTNPIYFSKDQTPWQLQAKVRATVVFETLIKAFYYIIPIIILCFIAYIYIIRKTIKTRLKPLSLLTDISKKISDGDLTQNIPIQSNDEIGTLADTFSVMIKKLGLFIMGVQKESENCKNAAEQVGQSSQTLNLLANEQAATGEEISGNTEEMTASVQQNAKKSEQIKIASTGMLSDINILSKSSEEAAIMNDQITDASNKINSIAFNIKILALNAAVEAARAGENGRGFAVVAQEIQKLSEHTTKSASEITEKIKSNSGMILKINNLIQSTVPKLSKLNDDIEEISSASQEQSINTQQVSESIQSFNNSSQETAASAEELSSTSEELKNQSEKLYSLTKEYKVE